MKLKHVQFVHPVSLGGSLQSASINPVGDRPGQTKGADIALDEKQRFISVTRTVNGVEVTRFVPMANVASFEVLEEKPSEKPVVKK